MMGIMTIMMDVILSARMNLVEIDLKNEQNDVMMEISLMEMDVTQRVILKSVEMEFKMLEKFVMMGI